MRRVFFVVLLGLTHACASRGNVGTAGTTSGGELEAATVPQGPAPIVRLIDPGQEPRVPLRLAPADGMVQTLEVATDMRLISSANGVTQMDFASPRMRVRMTVGPTRTLPDGALEVPFRYDSVDIEASAEFPAETLEAVRAQVSPLVGITGTEWLDPRGYPLRFELNAPPDLPDAARRSLEQMQASLASASTVFPDEPIGVGGEYEVTLDATGPPFDYHQRALYRVASIEGSRVVLEVGVEQTADSQVLPPSRDTQGFEVTMRSMRGVGSGTVTTDLTSIATTSELAIAVDMDMNVVVEDQPMETASRVETRVAVRTVD